MENMAYDLAQLKSLEGLDTDSAMRCFASYQAYFEALDSFIGTSGRFLRTYTPAVVLISDDIRASFLDEVQSLQKKLILLGMIYAASMLADLEATLQTDDPKALSDGLLVFYSEMDIMTRRIASARSRDN